MGKLSGKHEEGTRAQLLKCITDPPLSSFFPAWFLLEVGGWEGSHLLTLPLWCLPTSVPDGRLVGMLKFNADESWLTSWEINVSAGGAQGGEMWSYPSGSWTVGWQLMCLCAENNGWDCNTGKIRLYRPHAPLEVYIPYYRLIWG